MVKDRYYNKKDEGFNMEAKNYALPTVIVVLILLFILFCNPIAMVGVGERGVKVTLGKVSPQSFDEGIHLVTPFISTIKKMNVQTQKIATTTQVYTKDIQQAKIAYVINYNLQPENAHKMYREVGMYYEDRILLPVIEGTIKDVTGKWNAQDLVANREKATNEILTKLHDHLQDNYINVTDFQITNINYSDVFEKAIENKVTAEQEALKAKNKTVQIQEEAKQKLISAEAEAKSMSIRANALTQNKALVEYEAVQKWDGVLPNYMMGNTMPFINLGTMQSKSKK
ncbi:MAG: prohibitin family protein [Candidatus Gastranaerophilales bacterium]|nr:prohibitin family protein [Candidatus Gastranaerophilales bacterium]